MLAAGLIVISVLVYIPLTIRTPVALDDAVVLASQRIAVEAGVRPVRNQPTFDAAAWYVAREESPESHGVLIETLDAERTLASLNADVMFNPASLIKLATSLVALKKLGADFRFHTRVLIEGDVDSKGQLRGTLYIQGSDPTFGDAGAALIARELRLRRIERLSEIVVSPEFHFNFSNSPEESADRLVKALKLGSPTSRIAHEDGGQLLTVVSSNPLSEVLLYMNARSSNFIADKIGALIGGAPGVQQFLFEELSLPATQLTIATVSGRERNRMTPRDLLAVIRALIEEARRQGLEPSDILPVASDDAGTLRRRLAGTELEGAVVAKTGTLTAEVDGGMASLAGIVYTQDKGPIIFVILDQGNRIGDNRELEDQLLTEVVTKNARPLTVAGPTPRRLLPSASILIGEMP